MYCTECGTRIIQDAKFCQHCGFAVAGGGSAVAQPVSLPVQRPGFFGRKSEELPLYKLRTAIATWLLPVNNSYLFVATTCGGIASLVVGVLDVISPIFQLLSVAAVLSLLLFVISALSRKYLVQYLSQDSVWRRVLAPELSFYKVPILIATGTVAVLTVTGAAWSKEHRDDGGGLASKIAVVRKVQTELSVLMDISTGQVAQTKVLESIRDGESSNPRRALANQGTPWSQDEFRRAVERNDVETSALFLQGGMRWKLGFARTTLEKGYQEIGDQLLAHPKELDLSPGDCSRFMASFAKLVPDGSGKGTQAYKLTSRDTDFLKKFCASPQDLAWANSQLEDASKSYEAQRKSYAQAKAAQKPADQCERDLLKNDAEVLYSDASRGAGATSQLTFTPYQSLLADVSAELMFGNTKPSPKLREAIKSFCKRQAEEAPNIMVDDWLVQARKQIVDAID